MSRIGLVVLVLTLTGCGLFGGEPYGPRDCECELMDDWLGQLPYTPEGDTLGVDNVDTGESENGFGVGGNVDSMPPGFDRQLIEETLTGSGFNMRVDRDDDEMWNAIFYPGESPAQGPWTIDFTQTQGGFGMQVLVDVDGTPWGLETIDDLWESYQEDREAALQAQDERQQEAVKKLQPLEEAMRSMVANQP